MKKQLFIIMATTMVATTLVGCGYTNSKTVTDTTAESTVELTTPNEIEKDTELEQLTTTVADLETGTKTESTTTEQETTVEETPTTEAPTTEPPTTEAPTTEPPTTEPQDALEVGANVKVGDYIKFGSYEQDNDISNGKEKIEWLVLEIKDGKALLISKYGLDAQYYNIESEQLAWDKCTLRKWLNDTFLNTAFSDKEKMVIHISSVENGYSDLTYDKLFLLSTDEANTYFSSNEERVCQLTKYAEDNGAQIYEGGNCCWWLRSRGNGPEPTAVIVISFGMVYESGAPFTVEKYTVRPAMWIDLNT